MISQQTNSLIRLLVSKNKEKKRNERKKMATKELKLADLVNDGGICWDYSYDKDTNYLELSLDLSLVSENPTDVNISWHQPIEDEGVATVHIEEEEETTTTGLDSLEAALRQQLSTYLSDTVVEEIIDNLEADLTTNS